MISPAGFHNFSSPVRIFFPNFFSGGTCSALSTIPIDVLVAQVQQASQAGKKVRIAEPVEFLCGNTDLQQRKRCVATTVTAYGLDCSFAARLLLRDRSPLPL